MSDLEPRVTLIRTAIRKTTEAMARATQQKEHAALLAHLQRLQDLEGAVLSMFTVQAKGEE